MSLVMLDLDNTVADRQVAFEHWLDTFIFDHPEAADHRASIVEQDADGFRSRQLFFEALRDHLGLADEVGSLLADYRRLTTEGFPRVSQGVLDRLAALRAAGDKIAIVTNGDAAAQAATARAVGIISYIDALVISGAIGVSKPDPRIFAEAASQTGSDARGSWMIGDAEADVEGGSRFGSTTIWLRRSRTWSRADLRPDHQVDTIEAALDLRLLSR